MKKALVITPTTGSSDLIKAYNSIKMQTYPETYYLVVVDGLQFKDSFEKLNLHFDNEKFFTCQLPFNVGGGGFYSHRTIAGFSHLTNFDYILFLDQDNWLESNHVETQIKLIEEKNLDWSFSLRKIYSKEEVFLFEDNCESLGLWPIWNTDNEYLVDTNCYCFTNEFLATYGHLFHSGWGADRRFFMLIKDRSRYGCTGMYSVDYRLGGNEGSVQEEFFKQGNRVMRDRHLLTGFPWRNATIDLPFKV